VDTSGTFGSGAIGIIATNTGSSTNSTVTMGTFGSASNGTFGVVGTGGGASRTAGAGMTLLSSDSDIADEWAAVNVSPVTQTLGTSQAWGMIGIEIKASGGAGRRDVRALEYSGILQSGSPIDVSAAATGTSATASPGSMTTATASDLIADFNLSSQGVLTPATSFTQRVKNSFGDDAEDIEGAATGAYNPSVALSASGNWVASQVSFKPQTGQAPAVFSVTTNLLGTGLGTVTSNVGSPLINCPATSCSSVVTSGSTVILTAQATSGSTFLRWNGITGCDTSAQCTVPNITATQNVSATFNVNAGGTVSFYVNTTTGDDTRTPQTATSASTPWKTISHAVAAFTGSGANGTIIHVADGAYANTTISRGGANSTQRLVIQCDNGAANAPAAQGHCTISGSGVGFDIGANNIDIKGFDIGNNANMIAAIRLVPCGTSGASTCGNSLHVIGDYIHDLNANVSVDGGGCNVPGSGPAAILLPNKHGFTLTDTQIIGNIVLRYGPVNYPITCTQSNYAFYIDTPGAQIYNNLIFGRGAFGIQLYGDPCTARVSNNTIIGFQYAVTLSGGGEGNCTPGILTFSNNIMVGQTKGSYVGISSLPCSDGAHQSLFANNISDGAHTDFNSFGTNLSCNTTTPGTGNPGAFIHASGASLFVNYQSNGTGDYQLNGTSPAINAGTFRCVTGGASPCVPNFDILNASRPQRATIDIGAYELP
jgi:hypothetical protein